MLMRQITSIKIEMITPNNRVPFLKKLLALPRAITIINNILAHELRQTGVRGWVIENEESEMGMERSLATAKGRGITFSIVF